MKIIHVLSAYLPDQIAGTEVYVAALVRGLQKQGITSKIVIPNIGKTENAYYTFENTSVIKFAEPSEEKRIYLTGEKAPLGLAYFIKILEIEQPDIVHFHEVAGGVGVGIFHVEAAKRMGFKTFLTFHLAKYTCKTGSLMYMNETKCDGIIREFTCSKCWLHDSGESGLRLQTIKAAYSLMYLLHVDTRFLKSSMGTALALPKVIGDIKKNILKLQSLSDGFVVLTEWYKNILIKNGVLESHISLIKQGLPVDYTGSTYNKPNSKKLRLVFIGRISHFKGVDILIAALNEIPQNKVVLDIYGSATDESYMNKCLEISTGMENIFWKGSIAPHLVIDTIKAYDVLCIPSAVSEMGPLVLKESFAAGVPVLASDVYGNAEQVKEGENGWLFRFKDQADLKKKIEQLIEDPSLTYNENLKIPAINSFEMVADEHVSLYKKEMALI